MKRFIILLAVLIFPCVVNAETYCLKVEQGDLTEHCNYTQYTSFSQIRNLLIAGDVVDGMHKTYYEIWWLDGKNNIALKNATIDAEGVRDFGLWLSGTDTVMLDEITVKSTLKNGIWVVGNSNTYSKNITIHNCTVENSHKDGIVVYSGSENVTIDHSKITNSTERGIYVWAYRDNIRSITITNTEVITNIATPNGNKHGIHLYAEGYSADTEISDILISGNTVTLGDPVTGERIGSIGIWVQANGPSSEIVEDVQVPRVYFYDLEISNNKVSYGQSGGVAVGNVSTRFREHNIIQGNEVYNNGPDSNTSKPTHSLGLTFSSNIIVSNNLFHDNLSNGFDGVGVFLDALSSGLIVRHNTTYGHNYAVSNEPYGTSGAFNSSGIGICCGAHDNEVYYNVSYGNTVGITIGQALPIDQLGKIHHVYNNKIYNNVFAFNEVGIVHKAGYVPQWALDQGNVEVIPENCDATSFFCNELKNNIVYANDGIGERPGAGMWIRYEAVPPVEEHNIFYGNAGETWGNGTNLSNNTTGDPLFVDPHAEIPDFRLRADSPAIEAGTDISGAITDLGALVDFDGEIVPNNQLPVPDIGIDEFYCTDNDNDGYEAEGGVCGPVDCDENNPGINPAALEGYYGDPTCSDASDNDCDGSTDTADSGCKLPDLIISSLSNPPAIGILGGSFYVTDTTANTGVGDSNQSITVYYLSRDNIITASDELLTNSRSVPALINGTGSDGTVEAGIPSGINPGNYYLGACADPANAVAESNDNNNCLASTSVIQVKRK